MCRRQNWQYCVMYNVNYNTLPKMTKLIHVNYNTLPKMTKLTDVNYEIYGKLKVSGNLEELFEVQFPVILIIT